MDIGENPSQGKGGIKEGLEELPMWKVRKGGGEEIPLIQGKEQWLRFAGAAMKRYPKPKVRETQVRWVGVARGHQKADTETILTEN